MRIVKLAILGAALTIAGGLLVPADGAVAAVPHALPAPGAAGAVPRALPTSVATRVVSVDVDGDHQADAVTIEQNGADTFVVNVVTAAGQDDVVQVTSTIDDDWGIEPWYGAAKLDRVKGYELLVLTSGGDGVMFRVLTWRNGALVLEQAPKKLIKGAYDWYLADLGWARFGYRFSTDNAKRYVRDVELFRSGTHWKGTIVKSVWKSGTWMKLSSKKVTLTRKQARRYSGLSGVTVIERP